MLLLKKSEFIIMIFIEWKTNSLYKPVWSSCIWRGLSKNIEAVNINENKIKNNDALLRFKVRPLGPHTLTPVSLSIFRTVYKLLLQNCNQLPCGVLFHLVHSLKFLSRASFCFGKNKDSQGAKTGQHTWVMRCKTKRNLQMEWRISKRITMQSFTQKAFQCWLSKPTEECSHILCKVFSDWFSSSLKLPK